MIEPTNQFMAGKCGECLSKSTGITSQLVSGYRSPGCSTLDLRHPVEAQNQGHDHLWIGRTGRTVSWTMLEPYFALAS